MPGSTDAIFPLFATVSLTAALCAKRLAHSRLVMMMTSSEWVIAWCRFCGGAIGNSVSARPRRTCISLFITTGQAPRSMHTSATACASCECSSSVMTVTMSSFSTVMQTSATSSASFRMLASSGIARLPHSFRFEHGQDLLCEALYLTKLIDRSEAADEVVDAPPVEFPHPLGDRLRRAHGTPVGEVHGQRQLGVVLRDVVVEVRARLLLGVADVHRHLVGDGVVGPIPLELRRGVGEVADLLRQLLGPRGAAARHPAIAVLDDAPAGALHDRPHLVRGLVAQQAWVGDDPDRRRLLERVQRRHLGAGVERHVVVVEVRALEVGG